MDWTTLIDDLIDVEALLWLLLAGTLGGWWWWRRGRQVEESERERERAIRTYPHDFESGPVLNRIQRRRQQLILCHRTPPGVRAARAARVAAARERLHDREFFHQES